MRVRPPSCLQANITLRQRKASDGWVKNFLKRMLAQPLGFCIHVGHRYLTRLMLVGIECAVEHYLGLVHSPQVCHREVQGGARCVCGLQLMLVRIEHAVEHYLALIQGPGCLSAQSGIAHAGNISCWACVLPPGMADGHMSQLQGWHVWAQLILVGIQCAVELCRGLAHSSQ